MLSQAGCRGYKKPCCNPGQVVEEGFQMLWRRPWRRAISAANFALVYISMKLCCFACCWMCVDFILGPTFSCDGSDREELCARARAAAGVIVTVILKSMCSVASALEKRPLKSTDRMQNKEKNQHYCAWKYPYMSDAYSFHQIWKMTFNYKIGDKNSIMSNQMEFAILAFFVEIFQCQRCCCQSSGVPQIVCLCCYTQRRAYSWNTTKCNVVSM